MAFFDCQIIQSGGSGTSIPVIVNCDAVFSGMNITATDGTTTLSELCPATSPYSVQFDLPNSGTWTISGTVFGDTRSTTVIIPDSATLLPPVPTGSTVTPVNDIQIWLHCADIWNKNYTTIEQVLADASTLQALIASNNAADYMARSTSWASSVTANSSAMTYIGANNYCANKLLADSTWLNAICNSTYCESVLNVKVPTMTGDTTPNGEAFMGGTAYSSNYAYKAFDKNNSTSASYGGMAQVGYYHGYKSVNPVCVRKATITSSINAVTDWTVAVKGSNDGTTWEEIGTASGTGAYLTANIVLDNEKFFNRHAIFIKGSNSLGSGRWYVSEINFYGRE